MSYKYLDQQTIDKSIQNFTSKLNSIHTGRVNVGILESVKVEAYGTKMSVQELATVTIPEPSQLLISPFDKSPQILKAISKAIQTSDIGVNPQEDGAGVRLIFPPLTQEIRDRRAKSVFKLLEEIKISVRVVRKDSLNKFKKQKENGDISEDEMKQIEKDLQKEVEEVNQKCQQLAKNKEQELLNM